MKLQKRISLICCSILILAVALCSVIQILEIRSTLYHLTWEQIRQREKTVISGFQELLLYSYDSQDSPAVQRSLMHYCFSRVADGDCVLVVNGEPLYSEAAIPPEELLPIPDENTIESDHNYDGIHWIIKGTSIKPVYGSGLDCWIYILKDCTQMDRQLTYMAWRSAVIGMGCIVLGLCLIVGLINKAMKPLGILENTTARIAAGDYSQRANLFTKDEVGALTLSFNRMADSVEAKIKELTETAQRQRLFIGAVTHEFKTPLTGILLNADNLQNTYMTEEEQLEALSSIQSQGKWLERLVQQMLKLLTIRREIEKTSISVATLLERLKESTEGILTQQGISLEIQCVDFEIPGDMDLLQSALVNLVDNGRKASQPGQTISISAISHQIEVRDQGCGISEEFIPHLTEPFYMADRSRSKHQGGIGMGLALVQEIVNAHGAKLEIESSLGEGTAVRICF